MYVSAGWRFLVGADMVEHDRAVLRGPRIRQILRRGI